MKTRLLFLTALIASIQPAIGETALSGDAFDTYTRGKTLTYLRDGQAYGTEQYLPDHKVKWAFQSDECLDGQWFEPLRGLICFSYENAPQGTQCWNFFLTDNGLRAFFAGTNTGPDTGVNARTIPYEAHPSDEPLQCPGPKVGV